MAGAKPEVIRDIYTQYLVAGSDFVGTHTFSSTTRAQADYNLRDLVCEMNYNST